MIVRTMVSLFAALMLFFVVLTGPAAAREEATPTSSSPTLSLVDLKDIDQFQELFNEQAGKPRLILLISPT